jgi:hypothetical protein
MSSRFRRLAGLAVIASFLLGCPPKWARPSIVPPSGDVP